MTKAIFTEQRTMQRYDANHVNGYINETVLTDYHPELEGQNDAADAETEEGTGITAYQYDEVIIESKDMTRDNLVNGLIRLDYSETQEFAILRHHQIDAEKYADEWTAYNATVDKAKEEVARWLAE